MDGWLCLKSWGPPPHRKEGPRSGGACFLASDFATAHIISAMGAGGESQQTLYGEDGGVREGPAAVNAESELASAVLTAWPREALPSVRVEPLANARRSELAAFAILRFRYALSAKAHGDGPPAGAILDMGEKLGQLSTRLPFLLLHRPHFRNSVYATPEKKPI
ncbi:hypothetical protein HPB50_016646 [Hyalomma asiaticum]|uniref:Uncharacterized protein n=1 Tax=Hyalomma asiaticum TaxID=266040 RepID=A0ACB7TIX1_HYAAI|nr:hypothetical protein HPB50_016646 [Hyalomma asiaticum]